jgi:hypothetical protein
LWRAIFSEGEQRARGKEQFRYLLLTGLACLVAALINPFGAHILLFPFKLVGNSYLMDHVSEFISPNLHEHLPFRLMIYLLVTVLGLSLVRLTVTELLLVLLFTHMSLYSARYIPLFAIITTPILAGKFQEFLDRGTGGFSRFLSDRGRRYGKLDGDSTGHLWPLAGILLVLFLATTGRLEYRFDPKLKPVAAVEFLKREPVAGRMFNNDEFGDYVIYAAWPDYKVFFDGRSDMYGTAHMKEYYKIITFEDGWEKLLEKYDISWILFDTNSTLVRHLVSDSRWRLVYSDSLASILVRDIPLHAALVQRHPDVKLAPPSKEMDKEKE